MSDANQNIELGAEGTDAGLGDAEENLLWKPQNIQVLKYRKSESSELPVSNHQ